MYKFIFADVQKCFSREFVLAEKKEKYFRRNLILQIALIFHKTAKNSSNKVSLSMFLAAFMVFQCLVLFVET